jgi:hypothetical protein
MIVRVTSMKSGGLPGLPHWQTVMVHPTGHSPAPQMTGTFAEAFGSGAARCYECRVADGKQAQERTIEAAAAADAAARAATRELDGEPDLVAIPGLLIDAGPDLALGAARRAWIRLAESGRLLVEPKVDLVHVQYEKPFLGDAIVHEATRHPAWESGGLVLGWDGMAWTRRGAALSGESFGVGRVAVPRGERVEVTREVRVTGGESKFGGTAQRYWKCAVGAPVRREDDGLVAAVRALAEEHVRLDATGAQPPLLPAPPSLEETLATQHLEDEARRFAARRGAALSLKPDGSWVITKSRLLREGEAWRATHADGHVSIDPIRWVDR